MDDNIFDYSYYGKTVYHPKARRSNRPRTDLVVFDVNSDMKELDSGLVIGSGNSTSSVSRIKSIIIKYLYCFCAQGVCCTILDCEFATDTGVSAPICCRKSRYGPHGKPVIVQQINNLLKNKRIQTCGGSWGGMIVLADKPHQENVYDIIKFVWCICVSYGGWNKVTKINEHSISRYDMAITIIELGSAGIYFITVDAKQGYHQISVRDCNIEKLAFFGPDIQQYSFTVMPFGPINVPPIYTCAMGAFITGWDFLFVEMIEGYADTKTLLGGYLVTCSGGCIFLNGLKTVSSTKAIIDNVLIWSNNVEVILLYLEYVCRIFVNTE